MKIWQEKRFPVILVLLNIVLTLFIFDPRLYLGGDNITFIILGQSLLDGQGYRDLSQPDTPVYIGSPPGYPVFLMLLMLIFGGGANAIHFKLASLGLSCVSLFFFYRILQTFNLGQAFSFITALLVVVNFNILYPNHLELSDVLFNVFLMASLYFFMSKHKYGISLGVLLAVLATYTRYAGIVLIFALLAYLLLKKRFKQFWVYGGLALVLILPWALFVIAHGFGLTDILTGTPYAAERKLITLADLGQRWFENFKHYFLNLIPMDLFTWLQPPIWGGIIATAVILLGLYFKIRAKFSALELYFIFYIMLILSWPQVWSGERYILPIIYFMAIYFCYALFRLIKSKIFLAAIGLLVLYNASVIVRLIPLTYHRFQAQLQGKIARYYPAEWLGFFQCCNWISKNLPEQAIVVSRKPNMLYYQTGNRGFVYPFSQNHDQVYQKVLKSDYILVDQFEWTTSTRQYLLPALYEHEQNFQLIYRVPEKNFFILKVKK